MTKRMKGTFRDPSMIKEILPHREPFLFVDRVLEFINGSALVAEKHITGDEVFFPGHFPGKPVMPGVLVTEALAQASGLLLGLSRRENARLCRTSYPGLLLAKADIKFVSPALPGETLILKAGIEKEFGNLFLFAVTASVAHRTIAKGTLALGNGP